MFREAHQSSRSRDKIGHGNAYYRAEYRKLEAVEISGLGKVEVRPILSDRERNLEVDEDFIYTHKRQTWKIGAQSLRIFVHDTDPNTFNGAFTFAGGTAPVLDANNNPTGATTTISGLEQYRRALLNLPGRAPTTYQVTADTALVPFTRWQFAVYAEDTVKLSRRLSLSGGLRYAFQILCPVPHRLPRPLALPLHCCRQHHHDR